MKLRVSLRLSPDDTIPMGELFENGRDTAFEYFTSFLATELNPAPFRLPVKCGINVYDRSGDMETFGVFEDSLPDGWGRRIIDVDFRNRHGRIPSVLERLSCVGESGMGALIYEPAEDGRASPSSRFDLCILAIAALDFDAGKAEDVLPELRRAGGSSGGARPKAFIGYNPETGEACAESDNLPDGFEHWLVKFNTRAEGDKAGEREFLWHRAAVAAGATMSPCRLIETNAGKFFATKRFERAENGKRLHFASAAGLLHANFRIPGEEYLTLFRLTDALTRDYSAKVELFRRSALNVLAHNRDDHLKNFGYLMDGKGKWSLAPFYDFTMSEGPNGWHTLSVAGEGENPSESDLLRLADDAGLHSSDAQSVISEVKSAIASIPLPVGGRGRQAYG